MQFHLSLTGAGFLTLLALFLAPIWGGPIIALISEIMGKMYKKTFMDKFAQQMTRLGLLSMTIFWVSVVTLAFLTWQQNPALLTWAQARVEFLSVILGFGLAGTILVTTYLLTWKKLKKKKPAHLVQVIMAIGSLKVLFWGPLAMTRLELTDAWSAPLAALPAWSSQLWPLTILWIPLSVALTAILGLVYLVIRRNVDDFGRDYYKFTASFCAKWSLVMLVLVLPVLGWLTMAFLPLLDLNDPALLLPGTLAGASLFLVMLNCLVISRSETPMRHKASMFFAVLLSGMFIISTIYILGEGFSRVEGSLITGTDLKSWIEWGIQGIQALQ